MMKRCASIYLVFGMFLVSTPVWAEIVDGVQVGGTPVGMALPVGTPAGFDPVCAFEDTMPVKSQYVDRLTEVAFMDGETAILNQCSTFNVSGYSPPNFLAWNCTSRNADGTRPKLPLEIKFSKNVSSVSVNVASFTDAGAAATLRVYNSVHGQLGSTSVTLTSEVQTLSLAANGIRYMRLEGPCVMVADDLTINGVP